jgi:hypothetical protein
MLSFLFFCGCVLFFNKVEVVAHPARLTLILDSIFERTKKETNITPRNSCWPSTNELNFRGADGLSGQVCPCVSKEKRIGEKKKTQIA